MLNLNIRENRSLLYVPGGLVCLLKYPGCGSPGGCAIGEGGRLVLAVEGCLHYVAFKEFL